MDRMNGQIETKQNPDSTSDTPIDHVHEEEKMDKNLFYDMRGKKYLIIFNQHKFEKTVYYMRPPPTRNGTDKDVKRLTEVFEDLGFVTFPHTDLKYQEIMDCLTAIASLDHTTTSCICVVILTHGIEGGLLCAADRLYPFSDVKAIFETRSLADKPKIFILQACRGNKKDPGYHLKTGGHTALDRLLVYLATAANRFWCFLKIACGGDTKGPDDTNGEQEGLLPESFELYASVKGYVTYRNPEEGTTVIRELCNTMERYTDDMHFADMVTVMKNLVASHRKKQMPVLASCATKFLKF